MVKAMKIKVNQTEYREKKVFKSLCLTIWTGPGILVFPNYYESIEFAYFADMLQVLICKTQIIASYSEQYIEVVIIECFTKSVLKFKSDTYYEQLS